MVISIFIKYIIFTGIILVASSTRSFNKFSAVCHEHHIVTLIFVKISIFFTTSVYKIDNQIDCYQYLTDRSETICIITCCYLLPTKLLMRRAVKIIFNILKKKIMHIGLLDEKIPILCCCIINIA